MGEALGDWKRTCYCGDLRAENIDQEVTLMGWVNRRRDLGGLVFIDLRDREGIAQVVFNPKFSPGAHAKAASLRNEYVIAVQGKVVARPAGTENPELKTGQLEVQAEDLKVLSESNPPPFAIDEDAEVAGLGALLEGQQAKSFRHDRSLRPLDHTVLFHAQR